MEVTGEKNTLICPVAFTSSDSIESVKDSPSIAMAAQVIRKGGLVAFPTETVYGLGANGLDADAVAGIFTAKGRPSDNPLILHIASPEDIHKIVTHVPRQAAHLASVFWPGPLTLVLPKADCVPEITTGGLDTVAVRMPSHPVALALIRACGVPLAAPSANSSGRPSPTEAAHVITDLMGKIDVILDGGSTGIGVESTVLDCTKARPVILRPGGVSQEALEKALGESVVISHHVVTTDGSVESLVSSPGIKYQHYAPKAPALLVKGGPPELFQELTRLALEWQEQGEIVGIVASTELGQYWQNEGIDTGKWQIAHMGSRHDLLEVAGNIYRCLRQLDETDATKILLEGVSSKGLGLAIMNRLSKAAGHRIIGE